MAQYIAPGAIRIGNSIITTSPTDGLQFTDQTGNTVTQSQLTTAVQTVTTIQTAITAGTLGASGPTGATGPAGPITSYIFDGGNAATVYSNGPAFDCGSSI